VKVWDSPVRLLHWTLVAAVAAGGFSTVAGAGVPSGWHQPAGYVALAAVALRLVWSCFGSRHARLGFVRGPRATWGYARALVAGSEPRHVGHNPLGGWMIVALMTCVAGLAASGWLYTTDALWGDETVEAVHRGLAWALVGLAALHVAGVLFTSWRQRENLVAAMFSGRKRAPREGDVDA
jgi:cytochrome b